MGISVAPSHTHRLRQPWMEIDDICCISNILRNYFACHSFSPHKSRDVICGQLTFCNWNWLSMILRHFFFFLYTKKFVYYYLGRESFAERVLQLHCLSFWRCLKLQMLLKLAIMYLQAKLVFSFCKLYVPTYYVYVF